MINIDSCNSRNPKVSLENLKLNKTIKTVLPKLLFMFVSIPIASIIGSILLIAVYLLPNESIVNHVQESVPIFKVEHDKYHWAPGYAASRIDGIIDSMMLNQAAYANPDSAIKAAMYAPDLRYFDHHKGRPFSDNILYISNNSSGNANAMVHPYTRYWHGYLIWLKPCLMFFNYQQIRIFMMMFQFALLSAIIVYLVKLQGIAGAGAFLITVFFINPITSALSMQFACIYTLTLIMAMTILCLKIKGRLSRDGWKCFVLCGIAVAYFDFLTYPIVALGVPLILYLTLDGKSFKQGIADAVMISLLWGISYLGMWCSKWLMASILTGTNAFIQAVQSVQFRTAGHVDGMSAISVIMQNLRVANMPAWSLTFIIPLMLYPFFIFFRRYQFSATWKLVPLFIVALYPFIWYVVVQNHSFTHTWMSFRDLSVSLYGALTIIRLAIRKVPKTD